MKHICFIGKTKSFHPKGNGGDVIKNRIFIDFIQKYCILDVINTADFTSRNKIKVIANVFRLVCKVLFIKDGFVIATGARPRSCKFISLLQLISFGRPIYILGIGGKVHHYVTSSPKNIAIMSKCKALLVEGKKMVHEMNKSGLSNAYYTPNFKNINILPPPQKDFSSTDIVRFCFFARITHWKGCNEIFEAIDILKSQGLADKFTVTFFGIISTSYEQEFNTHLADTIGITNYGGIKNATEKETFCELASYHVMLFPTFWKEESFPATLIDAFTAGLPVIATDWNYNGEILKNEEDGFLIPIKDAHALAEKMAWFIGNHDAIHVMSKRVQAKAQHYDLDNVLSKDFLTEIGLI